MVRMIAQQFFLSILFCICIHFSNGFTTYDDISCWNHTYINDYSKCYFLESQHRLLCFNGLEDEWKAKSKNVEILIFCKWPKETFDPQEVLRGFTLLRELIIMDSNNLTRLTTVFSNKAQNLVKINVTGTKLHTFPEYAFSNLPRLECLDLTNNALEEINITAFNVPTLKYIYLAGNPLRCTKDTAWILDSSEGSTASKVADKDNLLCAAPYDRRPLVSVVEIIATLEEECKRTVCDCELIYVIYTGTFTQKQLKAFNLVNCSHRDLTEMPSFLPANTTTLFLTGNKIKDLTPLTSITYKSVLNLYLDDNLIKSIVVLEGSDWLDHFRLLNLRKNKLTELPTYVLENALLHNGNVAGLYLGNNSWTCDCHFTPSFQNFLIKYPSIIKDINDIRCALTSFLNNNISNKQIGDLTRTEMCIPSNDACLNPYDILSIIFASLIFLILGKLLYDYWSFKKTGKLPWISKILC